MKSLASLVAAALLTTVAGIAWAQDPAPPAEPTPSAPTASAPTTLFPDAAPVDRPTAPARGGRRGKRQRRNSQYATDSAVSRANSDPLEVRVAYRKAKTLAMARDPGIPELLRQADAEPTDDLKRAGLKEYYARLYRAVRKIDPSPAMKLHVDSLSQASQQRYEPKRHAINGEDDLIGNGRRNGRDRR